MFLLGSPTLIIIIINKL